MRPEKGCYEPDPNREHALWLSAPCQAAPVHWLGAVFTCHHAAVNNDPFRFMDRLCGEAVYRRARDGLPKLLRPIQGAGFIMLLHDVTRKGPKHVTRVTRYPLGYSVHETSLYRNHPFCVFQLPEKGQNTTYLQNYRRKKLKAKFLKKISGAWSVCCRISAL